MDDSNNSLQQQSPTVPVTPQVSQPQQPTPAYPVSGPHKEYAPVEAPVREYVEPHASEIAPTLPSEVEEFVEVVENKEQPQLTDEHREVGIEHAPVATPVVVSDQSAVQMPYTYPQAEQIVKETSVEESKHWLAALTEYLLRKLQLKGETHGTSS